MKILTKGKLVLALALATSVTAVTYAVSTNLLSGKEATHTATSELIWQEAPFGPMVSPVHGNFAEGGHVTFIKFPPGMKTPLHTHTSSYVGVVISGTSKHWLPGRPETEKLLPPGSHWYIPATVEHVSECLPGVECVLVVYQDEKFDFLPVEEQ